MNSKSKATATRSRSPGREAPKRRRRIDWQVLASEKATAPVWSAGPPPSELNALLAAFSELCEYETNDALLKHAVELALGTIGLVRAGIYLYDEPADLMLGIWGTSIEGEVIDEHHAMFTLGEHGRRVFDRAISGEASWTVIETSPLIDQRRQVTSIVGQGWVVCTPIRVADRRLGMLYNDAGLSGTPIDVHKQAQAALLCSLVGFALRARQHSNQYGNLPSTTARHPQLRKAMHRLTLDPALGGAQLVKELNISLSRLARLFKSEMGVSLVEYRNQLRLERFLSLLEQERGSLRNAARAAGFGSYAQFHRVFRALHGQTPRDYCLAHGLAVTPRD
jgi:AraC-like DNA-binding protein